MPTTRSSTKKQASLEDLNAGDTKKTSTTKSNASKAETTAKPNTSAKRKALSGSKDGDAKRPPSNPAKKPKTEAKTQPKSEPEEDPQAKPTPKQTHKPKVNPKGTQQAHLSATDTSSLEKPILINRSPVLQLWGACVASTLYPSEFWPTCLSVGASIAALCAITKGRSIGQIDPKDDSRETEDRRKKRKEETEQKQEKEIEVMGFPMHIKDGVVITNGKPSPLKEGTLPGKFGGEENYGRAKDVMMEALKSWDGEGEELDKKAFHMYEKFRPDVAAGGQGWGKKGELNLHEVKSVVER